MFKITIIILIFKIYFIYRNLKTYLLTIIKNIISHRRPINYEKDIDVLFYKKAIRRGHYFKALKKFEKIYESKNVKNIFSLHKKKSIFFNLKLKKILLVGGANHKFEMKKSIKYDYIIYLNQIHKSIEKNYNYSNSILCLNGSAVKRFVTSLSSNKININNFFVKTNGDKKILEKFFYLMNKEVNCYVLSTGYNNLTYGSPDICSLIIMNIISQDPDFIDIIGVDLFTSIGRRKGYVSSHQINDKKNNYIKRVNISFAREHSPFSIFLNMKKIINDRKIKIDIRLSNIIRDDLQDYSSKLNSIYGNDTN